MSAAHAAGGEARPVGGTRPAEPLLRRVAALVVLVALAIGCLALWTAVPAAGLWAASKLTSSQAQHFALGLPLTLASIALWGAVLAWLNGLYLQITESGRPPELDEDAARTGGPLESLLVWSLSLALVAFFVWFFVFAHNPPADISF